MHENLPIQLVCNDNAQSNPGNSQPGAEKPIESSISFGTLQKI